MPKRALPTRKPPSAYIKPTRRHQMAECRGTRGRLGCMCVCAGGMDFGFRFSGAWADGSMLDIREGSWGVKDWGWVWELELGVIAVMVILQSADKVLVEKLRSKKSKKPKWKHCTEKGMITCEN
jgi:hypothetical protein